jgi:hypothetical protein
VAWAARQRNKDGISGDYDIGEAIGSRAVVCETTLDSVESKMTEKK